MSDAEVAALYREVGLRIRAARIRRGWNQQQLADGVSMLRTSIVNIEAGRQRTPVYQLMRIARLLGVDVCALLPESNFASNPDEYVQRAIAAEGRIRELEQQIANAKRRAAALFT